MKLKILSWNIWFDGYFDQIKEFLSECKTDIICLQEVASNDPTRDVIGFLKSLSYEYVYSTAFELRADHRLIGNAVFSKHKISSTQTHILSEEHSRNAVQADIQIDGKILHIFSVHLLHTHQQPSETQERQTDNLIKALPQENVIVAGDFNAMPASIAVQKMNNALVNSDPTNSPTWSIYPDGCTVCKPQALDIRLDYIFTSKDIKTSSFKVEQSRGSDHLPITINIEI